MFKRTWVLALTLVFILIFAGCSNSESPTSENKTKLNQKETEVTEKPQPDPAKVYPLTGLPAKGDQINRRVVGVMINNASAARPQSGLHKADIVFEVLAEYNITRFLALYQSQTPDFIGPVRSARPYYIELLNGYNGIYVAHGWSPQAKDKLLNGDTSYVQGLFHDGTLFKRVDFRSAPHNSYITYENIIKGAKDKGYDVKDDVKPLPFLKAEEVSNISGQKVKGVEISYKSTNVVGYFYDEKTGLFQRYINGEPAHDRETNKPLTAANVLIISADHWFIDEYPRRAIDLKSGGEAYLLQKGKLQKVKWRNVDGRLLPFKDGEKLKFVPGQTWVNIIPTDRGFDEMVTVVQ